MNCAVCGTELPERLLICPACGFDGSSCAELYPTFSRNIGAQKTLAQRKKELEQRRKTFPEEFSVNPDGVLLNYTGSAETVAVPEGVRSIRKAFHFNKTVRRVILPEGLKRIGADAFSWSSLQSVELPESLTFIGRNAFANTDLSSVRLPAKLKTLESGAFADTAIQEIAIPGTTELISADAFSRCKSLRTVRLAPGVKTIGARAFQHCPNLRTIYIPDTLDEIGSEWVSRSFQGTDGIETVYASPGWKAAHPALLRELIPDPAEENNYEIEGTKLLRYYGRAAEPQIPEKVTVIGSRAFSNNSHIRKIVIPKQITAILSSAFSDCKNLREVTLPDSVAEIDTYTFSGCEALSAVHFPRSLKTIRLHAFSGTGLQVLALPSGLSRLESACFDRCERLAEVRLPDSLETIDKDRYNKERYDVFDPRWVKRFYVSRAWARKHQDFLAAYPEAEVLQEGAEGRRQEAENRQEGTRIWLEETKVWQEKEKTPAWAEDFELSGTKLVRYKGSAQEVAVPNGISEIGARAFENAESVRRVVLPDTVRSIQTEAFCRSGLEEITLPEGLERIADGAFRDSGLKMIRLPKTLRSIGAESFAGTRLQSVDLPGSLPIIPEGAFERCGALKTVRIREGVRALGPRAFSFCPALETVELPDSLTEISTQPKDNPFAGSGGVRTVSASGAWRNAHPDLLREMRDRRLSAREKAETSFQMTGSKLARYLGRDRRVTVPEGTTEIGARAFADNPELRSVSLPKTVSVIREYAFANCGNLSTLRLPDSVQTLEKGAFSGSGILILKVPEGVRCIPERLCENCAKLYSVTLPQSTVRVEPNAFSGCDQIASAADPAVLLNFRQVQIREGNECLMRGVIKSAASAEKILLAVSRNLGLAELSGHTTDSFLCDTDKAFPDKLAKASKAYAGKLPPGERPILLLDDSVFGSAKSGFLLTAQRICYKQTWEKGSRPISEVVGFVSQEERYGPVVTNGAGSFTPFFCKAKSANDAEFIAGVLDAACRWLRLLNEAQK